MLGSAVLVELVLVLLERGRSPAGHVGGGDDPGIVGRQNGNGRDEVLSYSSARKVIFCWSLVWLFGFFFLTGAIQSPVDFDVKEYHLQGPKEFFQQGRISFLEHNVYTSFPFLTEMLSLAGMVLAGDWWAGSLVGKTVLMSFAPLTAVTLFAAGRRWFSTSAGWVAALVFLTTPWTVRISIIAYTEGGLSFYLAATTLAVLLAIQGLRRDQPVARHVFLAGLLAGSGMACKYTGLVQVVLPALFVLAWAAGRWRGSVTGWSSVTRVATVFLLGTAVTLGPWLLKNLLETGNPVYPLGYTVFGGRDWDPPANDKWRAAHSSSTFSPTDLAERVLDVVSRNDWQSPLVFGLAPLALLVGPNRRMAIGLWLLVGWLFFSWWVLTHRLDRFWVPLIPVVALLAGIGATWSRESLWRYCCGIVVLFGLVYNVGLAASPIVGYNVFLADLSVARRSAPTTLPGIGFLNRQPPTKGQSVLCVGDAALFSAEFPVRYHTVFDRSLIEQWCKGADGNLLSVERIRERFRSEGVAWVLVNWQEILRYRETYGYTDFVTPGLFERLQELGVLGQDRFTTLRGETVADGTGRMVYPLRFLDELSPAAQTQVQDWGSALQVDVDGRTAFVGAQLFPVRP